LRISCPPRWLFLVPSSNVLECFPPPPSFRCHPITQKVIPSSRLWTSLPSPRTTLGSSLPLFALVFSPSSSLFNGNSSACPPLLFPSFYSAPCHVFSQKDFLSFLLSPPSPFLAPEALSRSLVLTPSLLHLLPPPQTILFFLPIFLFSAEQPVFPPGDISSSNVGVRTALFPALQLSFVWRLPPAPTLLSSG